MSRSFEDYQREKREREWNERVKQQKESMGNAERVVRATEWKRFGNDKFKAGNFFEACDYYREAVIYVEDLVEARRKERNDLLVPLYTNLAQVHLKLGEPKAAEDAASKALAIIEIPKNGFHQSFRAKALFRRALARKAQEQLEPAREDLALALKLQPQSEEVAREMEAVRASLSAQRREERAVMGGFLNREDRSRQQEEKRRQAEERRLERRARAEQRQQMQAAFAKLSQGEMLYEAREREMEPIRKKELEKRRTLELEQKLLNVIDSSKGLPQTSDFDDFMKKKEARCEEQATELDQKKKVLDKLKKEKQWDEDDMWRSQRDRHRERLEAERSASVVPPTPPTLWESKEVARWCEQRLRDLLLGTFTEGAELEPRLAAPVLNEPESNCRECVLKAIITDVVKLQGDAAVMRLNPHKAPLHYYDYFIKLDWEVAVAQRGKRAYRTGDELIQVAAHQDDGKAPPSVTEHRVSAGTFKIREFCSEEAPVDGSWKLQTKIKKSSNGNHKLSILAEQATDRLREKVERLLGRWVDEYREHWS